MILSKKEFTQQLAKKMGTTEKEAAKWADGYASTLIDIFKTRHGVSINGFGSFFVGTDADGSRTFKFNPSVKIRRILGGMKALNKV